MSEMKVISAKVTPEVFNMVESLQQDLDLNRQEVIIFAVRMLYRGIPFNVSSKNECIPDNSEKTNMSEYQKSSQIYPFSSNMTEDGLQQYLGE